MRNLKIIVEYEGTAYCGWQKQKNGVSIQQVLEEAIRVITGEQVILIGAGRTDAGVHALHQVAHFKTHSLLPVNKILMGCNSILPPDVVIKKIEEVSLDFHSLKDAKSKIYVYRIYNKRLRPVVGRGYFWHVPHLLDIGKMKEASRILLGKHDYSCFCATGSEVKDHVRTITKLDLEEKSSGVIEVRVEAEGFLKHMVRNIVGTLVEIGRGKIEPKDMKKILKSKNRNMAGPTAPARGLFLKEVKYE